MDHLLPSSKASRQINLPTAQKTERATHTDENRAKLVKIIRRGAEHYFRTDERVHAFLQAMVEAGVTFQDERKVKRLFTHTRLLDAPGKSRSTKIQEGSQHQKAQRRAKQERSTESRHDGVSLEEINAILAHNKIFGALSSEEVDKFAAFVQECGEDASDEHVIRRLFKAFVAARTGSIVEVGQIKFLKTSGKKTNLIIEGPEGMPPLMRAVLQNNLDLVTVLLQENEDLMQTSLFPGMLSDSAAIKLRSGAEAFLDDMRAGPRENVPEEGQQRADPATRFVEETLLPAFPALYEISDEVRVARCNALTGAIVLGADRKIIATICSWSKIRSGATFLNAPDARGETPLTSAIKSGDTGLVVYLHNQGVDITATNSQRQTPLLVAIAEGKAEIVQYLLDHEADPFDLTPDGLNALAFARLQEGDRLGAIARLLLKAIPKASKQLFDNINQDRMDGNSSPNFKRFAGTTDLIIKSAFAAKSPSNPDYVNRRRYIQVIEGLLSVAGKSLNAADLFSLAVKIKSAPLHLREKTLRIALSQVPVFFEFLFKNTSGIDTPSRCWPKFEEIIVELFKNNETSLVKQFPNLAEDFEKCLEASLAMAAVTCELADAVAIIDLVEDNDLDQSLRVPVLKAVLSRRALEANRSTRAIAESWKPNLDAPEGSTYFGSFLIQTSNLRDDRDAGIRKAVDQCRGGLWEAAFRTMTSTQLKVLMNEYFGAKDFGGVKEFYEKILLPSLDQYMKTFKKLGPSKKTTDIQAVIDFQQTLEVTQAANYVVNKNLAGEGAVTLLTRVADYLKAQPDVAQSLILSELSADGAPFLLYAVSCAKGDFTPHKALRQVRSLFSDKYNEHRPKALAVALSERFRTILCEQADQKTVTSGLIATYLKKYLARRSPFGRLPSKTIESTFSTLLEEVSHKTLRSILAIIPTPELRIIRNWLIPNGRAIGAFDTALNKRVY